MRIRKLFFIFLLFYAFDSSALFRVILATDDNKDYLQFWPICARMWSRIVGAKPTLAFVAKNNIKIDETLGDVYRFKPIPGIPTSFQAQCIRLLLPALFPDDICITSDIDLLPLQEEYFTSCLPYLNDYEFISLRGISKPFHLFLCWNLAFGKTYAELFNIFSREDIKIRLAEWARLRWGWNTDELILSKTIEKWDKFTNSFKLLRKPIHRIDRAQESSFVLDKLKNKFYTDYHCPRPFIHYKKTIDYIAHAILSTYLAPSHPVTNAKIKIEIYQKKHILKKKDEE